MITATVAHFDAWRGAARRFLASEIEPGHIDWQETDTGQRGLFNDAPMQAANPTPVHVPKSLITLAMRIALHRSSERWKLLYQLLWRMTHGEPDLPQLATDPLTHRLRLMDGEIRRDAHKAKAFVRFRQFQEDGNEHYAAWHRPDHRILSLVAPFFQRRFAIMRWSIFTPDESATWDGSRLAYGPGIAHGPEYEDATEDLWRTYYRSTFNPARIKIKMMKQEMPVRYWATLPESSLIPELLAQAGQRVDRMIATQEGFRPSAEKFLPQIRTLPELRKAAASCQGCPLHCEATQSVFGEGSVSARIMLVGEQPGAREDETGRPFVGPAGVLLDEMLEAVNLQRTMLYITNAVKHFKFTKTFANARLHKSPDAAEIDACKPWLLAEIKAIQPQVIVTLGVTAGRALIHQGFSMKHDSGRLHKFETIPVIATWHPAAILRMPALQTQAQLMQHVKASLAQAIDIAAPGLQQNNYN
jgi:DNA polymerase